MLMREHDFMSSEQSNKGSNESLIIIYGQINLNIFCKQWNRIFNL